jgi:hypothetical protein
MENISPDIEKCAYIRIMSNQIDYTVTDFAKGQRVEMHPAQTLMRVALDSKPYPHWQKREQTRQLPCVIYAEPRNLPPLFSKLRRALSARTGESQSLWQRNKKAIQNRRARTWSGLLTRTLSENEEFYFL